MRMDTTQHTAISAHQLSASLGAGSHRHPVLHGVSFCVPAGRWLSIVGPNGAGKSTLLKCLGGLLPFSGTVQLLGRDLSAWGPRDRARHLSWLGQGGAGADGADDLTAYDVTMLGRLPHQSWLSPPTDADHAAVEQALRTTQAWDWRERPLSQLSGGERQRVLLARALAVQAQVLLMDEPLANLDPPHQADWVHITRELVAQGKTVVSVLHELGIALLADELLVLADGRVRHQGSTSDAATHRALEAVFDQRIAVHSDPGQPGAHWVSLRTA